MLKNKTTALFPATTCGDSSSEARCANSTHHVWSNNGTYYTALTIHTAGYRKARVRVSLKTKNRAEAIERRDVLMRAMLAMQGYVSSPSLKHARSLPHHLERAA
jgi:hypothetical protein